MALIKSIRGFTPKFGTNCFLADNSTIVGDVIMGDDCSVWFNTVIRGDVNSISIGNKVNIQDGAVLHCLYEKSKINIGDNVSIGHNVIIHGATIHNNVLIGMGAIVMDHAVIGENSIIAAGALVLDSTIVEPGSIYGGVPAKRIKSIDIHQTKEMIEKIANNYLMYSKWYDEKS
ncbi:MAG: gamma carbonic anhydrase family protein [Bacteroidetes bacterium GWA2_31_9b]|nr:MAG: gamma carbonic anhydrase family protein [Bacteroidetes bacterium GWA2_31_9b]